MRGRTWTLPSLVNLRKKHGDRFMFSGNRRVAFWRRNRDPALVATESLPSAQPILTVQPHRVLRAGGLGPPGLHPDPARPKPARPPLDRSPPDQTNPDTTRRAGAKPGWSTVSCHGGPLDRRRHLRSTTWSCSTPTASRSATCPATWCTAGVRRCTWPSRCTCSTTPASAAHPPGTDQDHLARGVDQHLLRPSPARRGDARGDPPPAGRRAGHGGR